MIPYPTQLAGADFLANKQRALLADAPRCGKTGAAIMAADRNHLSRILTVTTASGRAVWQRAFRDWSPHNRRVQVIEGKKPLDPDVPSAIVGWSNINNPEIRNQLLRREWDLVIADEDHFVKNFSAARTRAMYGTPLQGGTVLDRATSIVRDQEFVWLLTGTPQPNSPFDWYPRLRALWPERLRATSAWPDVTGEMAFRDRYCVVRMKKLSNWTKIPVIVGGRNLDELKARVDGIYLRRTQQDVGIRPPIYETFPLAISHAMQHAHEGLDTEAILAAARDGDTKALEMQLGTLRRLTGLAKAQAIGDYIADEVESGLQKIVLAYWHRSVGDALRARLAKFGVTGIDGSTPFAQRAEAEQRFLNDPKCRVFLAQIQAAGEAIDLSAASELMFVETSFTPAQMLQMSLRVTNLARDRQAFVRVAVLAGSIDEAMEEILIRKWSAIRTVLTA